MKELIFLDHFTELGNKKLKVQSEMEEQCANGDLKEFDLTGDVEQRRSKR